MFTLFWSPPNTCIKHSHLINLAVSDNGKPSWMSSLTHAIQSLNFRPIETWTWWKGSWNLTQIDTLLVSLKYRFTDNDYGNSTVFVTFTVTLSQIMWTILCFWMFYIFQIFFFMLSRLPNRINFSNFFDFLIIFKETSRWIWNHTPKYHLSNFWRKKVALHEKLYCPLGIPSH